jgi:hypothetical protein
MPRGGSKPGERRGGRTKGTPNKRTLRTREELQAFIAAHAGSDPFLQPAGYLLAVLLGKQPADPFRLTAAIALLDRLLPKLRAVELSGDPDRPLTLTDAPARQARITALLAKRNGHDGAH